MPQVKFHTFNTGYAFAIKGLIIICVKLLLTFKRCLKCELVLKKFYCPLPKGSNLTMDK